MPDESLSVEIDETPFPRCQQERKDGSRCNGAVGYLPSGDVDTACHGCRKKSRRLAIIAELNSRAGSFDKEPTLYAADMNELGSVSVDDLAFTLALIS